VEVIEGFGGWGLSLLNGTTTTKCADAPACFKAGGHFADAFSSACM
jgi:hypothetical protein